MKTLKDKQSQRLENKKKKLKAFLEIVKLNDSDRESKESKACPPTVDKMPSEGESKSKRIKTHHGEVAEETSTPPPSKSAEEPVLGPSGKPMLSGEEYIKLRTQLKDRRKIYTQPLFNLKAVGQQASVDLTEDDRTPLFLSDVQHLLLYSLIGSRAPYHPFSWCTFEKFNRVSQTVVLMVEGLSLYDFVAYQDCFPSLTALFPSKLEVVMPSAYNGSITEELALVPLTSQKEKAMIKQYGSLEAVLRSDGHVYRLFRAIFPVLEIDSEYPIELPPLPHKPPAVQAAVDPKPETIVLQVKWDGQPIKYVALTNNDRFPRTHLVMSPSQLLDEGFPLPLKGPHTKKFQDYVFTKDLYKEVTSQSPMFALDCEMCMTTAGMLELTRIAIVDEQMTCLYDALVLPYNRITNYLTQYSGITPAMMVGVTKRLEDVQRDIREMLPMDAILVGQSLNGDLHTLRMMHPYVIDTSVIYNITSDARRKTKLSKLSLKFLGWEIQTGGAAGHCPTEDSEACMKLVLLKLANSLAFGDAMLACRQPEQISSAANPTTAGVTIYNYYAVTPEDSTAHKTTAEKGKRDEHLATSLFFCLRELDKTVGIVSTPEMIDEYSRWIKSPRKQRTATKLATITPVTLADNAAVLSRVSDVAHDNAFTIGHVTYHVPEDDTRLAVFREVDSACRKVWDKMADNGLCVVLFGGRKGGANGAAFIQVKRKHKLGKLDFATGTGVLAPDK